MVNEISVTIIGNLTAMPELRFTQAGKAWAAFTIASTPRFYNAEAKGWKDGTVTFMSCVAWGSIAEHISASLAKGVRVIAQGNLAQDDWEDADGNKHSRMKLTVNAIGPELTFQDVHVDRGDRRPEPQEPGYNLNGVSGGWPVAPVPQPADVPMYDDETPF